MPQGVPRSLADRKEDLLEQIAAIQVRLDRDTESKRKIEAELKAIEVEENSNLLMIISAAASKEGKSAVELLKSHGISTEIPETDNSSKAPATKKSNKTSKAKKSTETPATDNSDEEVVKKESV